MDVVEVVPGLTCCGLGVGDACVRFDLRWHGEPVTGGATASLRTATDPFR